MERKIFVNLPVTDLAKSRAFYEGMGFATNPQFSDDTAACMVWSDAIYVMILTHEKWSGFTSRKIPDAGTSEVMLCLSFDSREEVNALADKADSCGGTTDIQPADDHGFMMSRTVGDPDGHLWEFMWMDPAVASGEQSAQVPA